MGKMSILIPDDVEKRFRLKVLERLGSKKGVLSMAIAEAMELWIKSGEEQSR
jgi:hypothetical protein